MNKPTFFFYDLETSGLNPRDDRVMQFAGQRTDLDLNPIGEPINLLVELPEDTLPSPEAIAVTKITPQQTKSDGLSEREFAHYISDEIFTPGTIAIGYNSIRFDDEFTRHLLWRNFIDPYEWTWKDGRSRWDLLDVVRLTRALRPEGIEWPFAETEKVDEKTGEKKIIKYPTNRLELITKLNGIEHAHAHDALSDVEALISVTKLIKEKQPKLYNYLFALRDKRRVVDLVSLDDPKPFVYASGRYPAKYNKTTVAIPIAPAKNGSILVFDLRYNVEDLLAKSDDPDPSFFPAVKSLAPNRCPAVAPLGVLSVDDGWQKIDLDKETVEKNLFALRSHPEFIKRVTSQPEKEFDKPLDAESALYDGFLGDSDRVRVDAIRNASADKLKNFHPDFVDKRLPELLLHYKAKNFPETLDENEAAGWEKYRLARLNRQAPAFLKSLEVMKTTGKTAHGLEVDPYIVEELALWFESLQAVDY